jgi:murein DD-endopeptidase MepM/ murein hydrolase activator NlpD
MFPHDMPARGLSATAVTLLALAISGPAAAQPAPRSLPMPVPGSCISSPFGPRHLVGPRASTIHSGVDFPAPVGTYVRALAAGEVVGIQRRGAEGLEVDVRHPGGFSTRYAHLGTVTPKLASGGRHVEAGEALGRVGRTGVTYGTHVHLELRIGDTLTDPEPFIATHRCGGPPTPK